METFCIAVSQRHDYISSYNENRDSLDNRLVNWLQDVGCLALPVPNTFSDLNSLNLWLSSLGPSAVLLSGGNNIGECYSRDVTEEVLIKYAESLSLPLLGICRGMQMLAHYEGTSLVPVDDHCLKKHDLISNQYQNLPRQVNSYHTFQLSSCPTNYHITATSPDGCIEAISHNILPWEGWMWHPERDEPFHQGLINRARRIFFNE